MINGALPLQSRKAEIPAASVNAETREFDIVISTGAKVRRYRFEGWDTRIAYDEELVISDKACNTERVRSGAVMMLDSHSTWGGVTQTFGKLTRAWVEGGKAPGAIVASARGAGNAGGVNPEVPADWSATRTRPLCPFPAVAVYKGRGDVESAASWACRTPKGHGHGRGHDHDD